MPENPSNLDRINNEAENKPSESKPKSPWNSLEVAKLCASLVTPLVVGLIGFWVQSTIASRQEALKGRELLANRRLAIYDDIRKDLNRIYCFVEDVGSWKSETPSTIIAAKRTTDQVMYSNQAIWSPSTFKAYTDYTTTAFAPYQGVGLNAKIRTSRAQKAELPNWKGHTDWLEQLTNEKAADHRAKYNQMVIHISDDLVLMNIPNDQ